MSGIVLPRERILAMGEPGTGKTTAIFSIAEWHFQRNSPARFFYIDTDDTVPRFLYLPDGRPSPRFGHLAEENGGNLIHLPVFEYNDYLLAQQRAIREAQSADWVVVDMIDMVWGAVQDFYTEGVFGKSTGQYFMEMRRRMETNKAAGGKDKKNFQPLDGWKDWPVINKVYRDFMLPLAYKCKGHLYATTKVDKVGEADDALTRETFGAYGVKPAGQKHLGHQVQTILWFQLGRDDEGKRIRQFTSIKDRERIEFDKRLIPPSTTGFAKTYLFAAAGWRL